MATFLELVQRAAGESGTFQGFSSITTTVGQTGRKANLIYWVRQGYVDIQLARPGWLWMQGEFEGVTAAGTQRYSGATLTGGSRFSGWTYKSAYGKDSGFSIYPDGVQAEEGPLSYLTWNDFHRLRLRGAAASMQDKPFEVTITPQLELALFPIPDAVYRVRGLYRKTPQLLAADADVPEMPAEHHDLIWQTALVRLAISEESQQAAPFEAMRKMGMNNLMRDQLPRMTVGGPLDTYGG